MYYIVETLTGWEDQQNHKGYQRHGLVRVPQSAVEAGHFTLDMVITDPETGGLLTFPDVNCNVDNVHGYCYPIIGQDGGAEALFWTELQSWDL